MPNKKVNFGFAEVDEGEKEKLIGSVFSRVASRYDLMNDLMSFYAHRLWKDKVAEKIKPKNNLKILDVAGGTGDMAFRFYENTKDKNPAITILDINEKMLEEGKKRSIDKGLINKFEWVNASGESLPFNENEFDYYNVSFGIRNFTNIQKGLEEAYRTLNFGGQFICLEFTPVENIFKKIYDFYSFNIIPNVGELVTGDKASYQYLVESIRKFPDADKFKEMIELAGFKKVKYEKLAFGAVAIHTGWKI